MFEKEKCDQCAQCLFLCPYLGYTLERAKDEFQKLYDKKPTEVLEKCITCFACEELCPKNAHPFDLILEAMQELNKKPVSEEGIEMALSRYVSTRTYEPPEISGRVISGCVFPKTHPHLFKGPVFEGTTLLQGRPLFCYVLFLHMGDYNVVSRKAKEVISNLAKTGAEEIVFFHDDCYALVKNIAPRLGIDVRFKAKHLVEYLKDWLNLNSSRVSPLGISVAYQRPCASRYSPEKEHIVDEVFKAIGVTRIERTYDRENALCCGGAMFLTRGVMPKEWQEMNLVDARDKGAKELVCLCPMCIEMLRDEARRVGIELTFFTELVQRAIS